VIEQSQKSSGTLKPSSKFFFGITSLFITFFVWMWFAKVDITTQAPGYVTPFGDVTTVGSLVNGKVNEVLVREGEEVKKGDIIIKLTPTVTESVKEEIEIKLKIVKRQLEIKKDLVGQTVSESEYIDLEKEEAELNGALKRVTYELDNSDIKSPINGIIQSLTHKNIGGVVKDGTQVATIIPNTKKLIIEGKLFVKDRGYVKVGQSAKVKLANQDALKFDSIDATIISISPDAVQSQTGAWYEIQLELKKQKFTAGNIEYILVPGIQVQIYILTGERTILSYVTSPFHNSIGQALQER